MAATVPTPVPRQTSATYVARHIRALVVDGTLRRGDRVPQEEIAAALGVSRIPVREAIVGLDREGWVTIEPHRGAFVHGVDEPWVRDHYEVLGALWSLVAGRAAERADATELTALRALHRDLAAARDVERFDTANAALLQHLLVMAHSPRLTAALRAVTSIVPGNFFAQVARTMEPQRRAIAGIVRAVARRDRDGAARRMARLLDRAGAAVVAELARRGVLADAPDAPTPSASERVT